MRFNQLAKESMQRVRYVKTCPDCNRELGPDDIVRGYQYEKGKYVVVSDEELDAIKTDADRAMKIVQFVGSAGGAARLLREALPGKWPSPAARSRSSCLRLAMVEEGKAAIGTTVLGNSETPLALIPYGDDLVMMTLHYQSEVQRRPEDRAEHPDVADAELDMAKQPGGEHDRAVRPRAASRNAYQEKLMQPHPGQDSRQADRGPREATAAQPANIINLMDALAASLKARTGEDAGGAKASSAESAKAPKPKRKPPAKRAG